jgi:lambda repressor-like predicted transcriptional regulator
LTRPPWNQKSITYRGKTLTVVEWSRQTGINRRTIADRLSKGWPPSRILAKASVNSE